MRTIRKEIEVEAAPAAVWEAWATAAGAVTFFAPEARIGSGHAAAAGGPGAATDGSGAATGEQGAATGAPAAGALRPGDPYEILFLDAGEAPEGGRGSEGCRVLAHVPGELLAFDWNAPPRFPGVRASARRAWVVVEFRPGEGGASWSDDGGPARTAETSPRTLVRLTHLGFGEGEEWDAVFAYFGRAWDTVLARLARRFVSGPVDWRA